MSGDRPIKQRLKTATGRSHASQLWLQRQINDPLVHRAKREGYRARSVYKLQEVDQRFRLIRAGTRVLDLGAAPGSWSQYAARRGAVVVAVDLLPMDPIARVDLLQGDFLDPLVQDELLARLGGRVDLLLSDMAANTSGQRTVDRLKAEGLGEAVLELTDRVLAKGAHCLIKLIKGGEAALGPLARPRFESVRSLRPKATRQDSSETYMLAQRFRGGVPSRGKD